MIYKSFDYLKECSTLLKKVGISAAFLEAEFLVDGDESQQRTKVIEGLAWSRVRKDLETQASEVREVLGLAPGVLANAFCRHSWSKQGGGYRWRLYAIEVVVFEAKALPQAERIPASGQERYWKQKTKATLIQHIIGQRDEIELLQGDIDALEATLKKEG